MRRFIRSLQKKPRAVRDQIAFSVASVFVALVCIVWLSHLSERFTGLRFSNVADDTNPGLRDQLASIPSPFAAEDQGEAEQTAERTRRGVSENDVRRRQQSGNDESASIRATSASMSDEATETMIVGATTTAQSDTANDRPDTTVSGAEVSTSTEPRVVRIVTTPATASSSEQ